MPTPGAVANRRLLVYLLVAAAMVSFLYVSLNRSSSSSSSSASLAPTSSTFKSSTPNAVSSTGGSSNGPGAAAAAAAAAALVVGGEAVKGGEKVPEKVAEETLKGAAIMGKLGNETLKAELGRAAWKLFHTTMARFPEQPSADEQGALSSYIHLFARLYPCGECASHFQKILAKSPPQVKTRNGAAAWACHVHNEVNLSLGKAVFDCANIGDFYDCGCEKDGEEGEGKDGKGKGKGEGGEKKEKEKEKSGDGKTEGKGGATVEKQPTAEQKKQRAGEGGNGKGEALVLEKEDKTRGG